jgi:hypothetical protein
MCCSCVAGDRRSWLREEEFSMAKAAAAQTTVTLKHLAAALAGTHEMAKKQSELILNDLVGLAWISTARNPPNTGVA